MNACSRSLRSNILISNKALKLEFSFLPTLCLCFWLQNALKRVPAEVATRFVEYSQTWQRSRSLNEAPESSLPKK